MKVVNNGESVFKFCILENASKIINRACLDLIEAIEKITNHRYDIVFMDHMMPELDGVETTHIIRRFHPEYDNVPIIALTANAIHSTMEMFLQEGMNDFIAKPIEVRIFAAKVKKWLPLEKVQKKFTWKS